MFTDVAITKMTKKLQTNPHTKIIPVIVYTKKTNSVAVIDKTAVGKM